MLFRPGSWTGSTGDHATTSLSEGSYLAAAESPVEPRTLPSGQPCRPHFHQARDCAIWLRAVLLRYIPSIGASIERTQDLTEESWTFLNCTQSRKGNVGRRKLGWLAWGLNRHRLGVKLPAEVLRLEEFGWAYCGHNGRGETGASVLTFVASTSQLFRKSGPVRGPDRTAGVRRQTPSGRSGVVASAKS
jgi:hypothetical protein